MSWVLRIVAGLLVFLVLLVAALLVGGAIMRSRIKANYPLFGQMVDVGGHKLHFYCQGVGSPTAILLSGSYAPSPYQWLVQTEVARTTRVCAYDRAGYGWSDDSTHDLSPRRQAGGLWLLLAGAGLVGRRVARQCGGRVRAEASLSSVAFQRLMVAASSCTA